MAASEYPDVLMVHYECGQCSMIATAVSNRSARAAWRTHMESHPQIHQYRAWHWTIVPLQLDESQE